MAGYHSKEVFEELFNLIYKGHEEAIRLSFDLLQLAHTWDDLVDGDKEVSGDEANTAFVACMFTIPTSPLWGVDMQANLLNVYLRWQDANSLESDKASTDDDLAKAWMLRAGLYDLFVLIATKLYGLQWAKEVGPVVRKCYGETLADFIKEIRYA